jgi:hypothetical protein
VVEGLLYRHKVEHDGKPLSGKEAAEEEKHYEEAVAERRAMKSGRGLHLLWRTYQFDPPTSHLQTLFDNRVLRTEMVNGRETLVVESTPKPDAKPKNQGEKSSLDWKQTTWIDLRDAVPARTEMEQLHDHKSFLKGSTMKTDFSRRVEEAVDEGEPERAVWLQTETHWEMGVKIYWLRGSVKGETTWTNFKKFQVDMRLLEETMQEVPEAESR